MNNASFETEDRIAVDASARADNPNQAGAEPLNGNGFYRFKIGDFQATVISDGQGPIPVSPIFVMNASEAELAPVLRANFMQPVIQATNNPLVVDTGRERILVDTGFGEKIGPPFGSFPRLRGEPGQGRNRAREHRSGGDLARSPGPYRRPGDANRARWRFRRLSSSSSIRSGTTGPAAVSKARSTVRRCPTHSRRARLEQLERTCRRSPTGPGS